MIRKSLRIQEYKSWCEHGHGGKIVVLNMKHPPANSNNLTSNDIPVKNCTKSKTMTTADVVVLSMRLLNLSGIRECLENI